DSTAESEGTSEDAPPGPTEAAARAGAWLAAAESCGTNRAATPISVLSLSAPSSSAEANSRSSPAGCSSDAAFGSPGIARMNLCLHFPQRALRPSIVQSGIRSSRPHSGQGISSDAMKNPENSTPSGPAESHDGLPSLNVTPCALRCKVRSGAPG